MAAPLSLSYKELYWQTRCRNLLGQSEANKKRFSLRKIYFESSKKSRHAGIYHGLTRKAVLLCPFSTKQKYLIQPRIIA